MGGYVDWRSKWAAALLLFGLQALLAKQAFGDAAVTLRAADHTQDSVHIKTRNGKSWDIRQATVVDGLPVSYDNHITSIVQDANGNIRFTGLSRTLVYNAGGITSTRPRGNRRILKGGLETAAWKGKQAMGAGHWEWRGDEYDARGAR